jgi:hypothetical protein
MAVLATLEQARVLPPEGTKEADRIIKSVIQLQSLFATSTNPSVQDFLHRAVARQAGEQTAPALAQFQSDGWTPDVLKALADAALAAPPDELQLLVAGLESFNLSVEDFRQFMQLVRDSDRALVSDGRHFHEVFASYRKTMPGAKER